MFFVFYVTMKKPNVFSLHVPTLVITLLLLFQVSFSTSYGPEPYEYMNYTVKTIETRTLYSLYICKALNTARDL